MGVLAGVELGAEAHGEEQAGIASVGALAADGFVGTSSMLDGEVAPDLPEIVFASKADDHWACIVADHQKSVVGAAAKAVQGGGDDVQGEQGSGGAGEQGSRGAGEQGSKGAGGA